MGEDERRGIVEMTRQRRCAVGELGLRDEALRHDPIAKVVDELEEDRATAVAQLIPVDQRLDADVGKAGPASMRGSRRPTNRSIPFAAA